MEGDGWLCVVRKLAGDKKHLQPQAAAAPKWRFLQRTLNWFVIILFSFLSKTTKHPAPGPRPTHMPKISEFCWHKDKKTKDKKQKRIILLFVCLLSGPATDDKHFFDCFSLVVSTINFLGPGRTKKILWYQGSFAQEIFLEVYRSGITDKGCIAFPKFPNF